MDDYFDNLLDQQDPVNSDEEVEKKVEETPEIPKCDHPEVWHSMCLICEQTVSNFQMKGCGGVYEYREYALLGRGRNLMIRSDQSKQYIEKQVENLFT